MRIRTTDFSWMLFVRSCPLLQGMSGNEAFDQAGGAEGVTDGALDGAGGDG